MMSRATGWLLALATVLATLGGGVRAQSSAAAESAKVVTVQAVLSRTAVRPGETVLAAVVFTVQDGWHINSDKPTEAFLVPTKVALTAPARFQFGPVQYPPARTLKFGFSPKPLSVFEGRNVVRFPITVASGAKPGTLTVPGTLSYQPCNATSCFAPARKSFTLAVPVAKPGDTPAPANAGIFGATGTTGTTGATGGDRYAQALASSGLLVFLLLVFVGGLLLNLTPCVYPMIAVTMAIFGARAGDARSRVLGRAAIYVLGMATMYTALGVFAGLTGNLFGGILQNVWVKVGIAAFLLVMALGMFGLFTLQPPPKLAAALGGANRTGTIGLYLSGLVVGIFAAPCVGPVVLGLLTLVGQKQDPLFGAVSFFVLALGLGTPYILLAASTGLLTRLPRSGAWMEWTKHVFGVILLGVAAYYLALALAPGYALLTVPVAMVAGAIYLGFFDRHGEELRGFQTAKLLLGTIVAIAGVYVGAGALEHARMASQAAAWPVYSDAAFQGALAGGQPIVMDFSASWCAQCRELEAKTFSSPDVQKALEPFARFRVDLDGANAAQADALQRTWRVKGLPAIVFLDGNGREVEAARVGGFLPPRDFLSRVTLAHPQVATR